MSNLGTCNLTHVTVKFCLFLLTRAILESYTVQICFYCLKDILKICILHIYWNLFMIFRILCARTLKMLNLWVSHDNHLFLKLGVNLSNATMHNIHKGEFLKAVLDFFEDFFLNFSNRNDSYIVMIRYFAYSCPCCCYYFSLFDSCSL